VTGDDALEVILGGKRIGTVRRHRGLLAFRYDDEYRRLPDATPLSLSMPLTVPEHQDDVVSSFLWGLLPDNERVLERWARTYQVSARNAFGLLRHVGADCAGAAQFVPADRVQEILDGDGNIEWIDEREIGRRLRTLRGDPTAWHLSPSGQFSLAGAQAKTALYLDQEQGRWGDPGGAAPTTHIIKPAVTGFDEHDLNEHICLLVAHGLGMRAARSEVVAFDGERAIVVERYDRHALATGRIERLHQEDMCQALGKSPFTKYQNEGGPSPEDVIRLLRDTVAAGSMHASIDQFVNALAFNWLIGGTDAHAKNYSMLLSGAQVRPAPLYDVASALPYDDMFVPKLKMAMRIGGEYTISRLSRRHWVRFAEANDLDPEATVRRIDDLAARVADGFAAAADSPAIAALGSGLPRRLASRVSDHVRGCRRMLSA
jgi:serine/threonine-protein kinase HipA